MEKMQELAFFSFAAWALHNLGANTASWVFGILTLIHYILSFDRLLWLFHQ